MSSTPTPTELREAAREIAEQGGEIAMRRFRAPLDVVDKADGSPVTAADRDTERFVRDALAARFPGHALFGEEHGASGALDGPTWIIDPIDGTRSYVAGHPLFGLLLGFIDRGEPLLGLVRMPALGETFIGVAGLGATLNGTPIASAGTRALADAIVFVNEAERLVATHPALFARLCGAGRLRRMAYDCYPHALLAAGHVDAVVDCGLEPYDYLPLVALIDAAGGVISDWRGEALSLGSDGRVVSAATPELHAELLALLNA